MYFYECIMYCYRRGILPETPTEASPNWVGTPGSHNQSFDWSTLKIIRVYGTHGTEMYSFGILGHRLRVVTDLQT